MRTYPIPFNEEARLRAVFDIPGLTAQNEALFDTICEAARTLLDCPIAHISVVEEDSQWYKSVVGMHLDPMPKDTGFCAHTIMSDAPMIVPDLSKDARFERHPMVAKGGPEARYYAGVPLILSSGAGAESRNAIGWVVFGGLGSKLNTKENYLNTIGLITLLFTGWHYLTIRFANLLSADTNSVIRY